MAKNRSAQQRSPELPKLGNPALNQQSRRPLPPIHPSPRLKMTNQKKPTITERRRRVNPSLHQPLPWTKLLIQLIQKRPLLLLLTFCGGMLIVACLAFIGLTLPELSGKSKSQPTPVATSVSPTTTLVNTSATTVNTQTQQNPPLGLYVVVGAGCVLGAWLLYRRRLKVSKMRHKSLPKTLSNSTPITPITPAEEPDNSKPLKRKAPASRQSPMVNAKKILVADSMMRWSNGQSLTRNSQQVLTDTTEKRRKQSLSSQ